MYEILHNSDENNKLPPPAMSSRVRNNPSPLFNDIDDPGKLTNAFLT